MTGSSPELRILFFLLHPGYIRHFRPLIELLADRGHRVHLAFTRLEKDAGDGQLAHALTASWSNITFGDAPRRRGNDGWRSLAMLVRSLVDLGRYTDPRYAEAPALRQRMAVKLTEHVETTRAIDPLTRRAILRLIQAIATGTGARRYRRLVRWLGIVERAIPTCRSADRYLREHGADVVLVTPLIEFASSQVEYVKSARKAGIPCGVCVASWDNLTGKGLIRVEPDRVFVWNEEQVREATEMHGIARDRVVPTGAQKFDEWFERKPGWSAAEFAMRVGLDPKRPYVLYVCSSPFIAPDETAFVKRWISSIRASDLPVLEDIGVLVRPHPQNAEQWRGVDLSAFGNATIWPPHGAQPDAGAARADFFDSLAHSAAVVGINTSALIEAAILGKGVLAPLASEFAGTQSGTLHWHYLLNANGGVLQVGEAGEEHLAQLAAVVEGGEEHSDRSRRFVGSFVRPRGLDRPVAPIFADAVEELAGLSPAPARRAAGDRVLRLALTPLALGAQVTRNVLMRRRGSPQTVEIV